MSKNAKYVDMEASVTVSLSAEISGKRQDPEVVPVDNSENNQSQLLLNLIRALSGSDCYEDDIGVSE